MPFQKRTKYPIILTCVSCVCFFRAYTEDLSFTIGKTSAAQSTHGNRSQKTAKMPLFIGLINMTDRTAKPITDLLKTHLERSAQLDVTYVSCELPKIKQEITALFDRGFMPAFFLSTPGQQGSTTFIDRRLYDTMQAELIAGKRMFITGINHQLCARLLATEMWKELMGDESSFLTKICYIKKPSPAHHSRATRLCMRNADGSDEKVLLSSPCILVAPAWGAIPNNPFVTYSEFTRSNVRLMLLNLTNNRKKTVVDLDGTTAGVSSVAGSDDIVYGRSGGIWRYHYDTKRGKGMHQLIIKENDVCASPTLLSNGDIIYCSRGKIKRLCAQTGVRTVIVGDGYNVGPAFNEKTTRLVYSRRVKGTIQLFMLNLANGRIEQLTTDAGDKTDACWSPCGQWIAFCVEKKGISRIMVLHVGTDVMYPLTPAEHNCCYPNWSKVERNLFE